MFNRRKRPDGASREAVIWAYRLLLGREPESEDAIVAKSLSESRGALVRDILVSPEFAARCLIGRMDHFAPPLNVDWQVDAATVGELLTRTATTWTRLGQERPYWSVLAEPEYLPENASTRREAFYNSGAGDLRILLTTLERVGCEPAQFDVLFEFGCGLGRVTRSLCKEFKRVIACDISNPHLSLARQALDEYGITNVQLKQATVSDFGMSEPHDLWFSRLVLQHNPPPLIAAILERALTLLRPQGLAVFQVPVYSTTYRFRIDDEYRRSPTESYENHLLPQPAVLAIARRAGCALLEVREDDSAGPAWISQVFTFQKT